MADDNDPYAPPGINQPGMGDPHSYMPSVPFSPGQGHGAPMPPPMPPPMYAAPAGQYYNTGSDAKNVYGILALVFPFAGLSLIGIIMGHMGLAAVKNGQANNRGIALAGTVLSYVFTLLGAVWVAVVIALAVSDDFVASTGDLEVEGDLAEIGREVSVHWIDATEPPEVRVEGGNYVIGTSRVPVSVEDPQLDYYGNSSTTWCVELSSAESVSLASFSALAGYQDWLSCSSVAVIYGDGTDQSVAQPDPDREVPEGATVTSLFELDAGDCILDPYDEANYDEVTDTYALWDVLVVPCDMPHYEQVTLVAELPDTEYPGLEEIFETLDVACVDAFEDYVGIDYIDSEYYIDYFYPTESSWSTGDREYTCLAYGTNGITGSLEGAAR